MRVDSIARLLPLNRGDGSLEKAVSRRFFKKGVLAKIINDS